MSKKVPTPNKETILKFLKDYGHDGWSIVSAEGLVKTYGFPPAWLKPYQRTHVSGNDYKSTISVKGRPVKQLKGVYVLTVLSALASQLNAECESKLGRGSQASAYSHGIRKALGEI